MYVQSFLRPRIFTFLLSNTATVYNFVKKQTLLLLTVSVEAFLYLTMCYMCIRVCSWVNISAAMT